MRSDDLYLWDIVNAAKKIVQYTKGKGVADLLSDTMLFDAVVREFQVLGEASMQLSIKKKSAYALPWKEIIGFRNVIVHNYVDIKPEIILYTATNDIPEILRLLSEDARTIEDRMKSEDSTK